MVRAWEAAKTTGVRLVAGCRLDLRDGAALLAYPTDRPAWSRLCRLITLGKCRAGKTGCDLDWDDLAAGGDGLLYVLLPDQPDARLAAQLDRLRADAPGRAYLAGTIRRRPGDAIRLHRLAEMGQAAGAPLIATGDVLYHHPGRRILQDVVTCIREGCTIDAAGFRRERHADRHLKPPEEMARLFARHPDAIARTTELVERCRFDLSDLRYQYPDEVEEPGLSPQDTLERLTWEGAERRYPGRASRTASRAQLTHELRADPAARIRALFPDREQHRPLCAQPGHPLPGPRLGRQLGRLLRARRHQHRSRPAPACCSSASSPPSAMSRRISTSISSTSGART